MIIRKALRLVDGLGPFGTAREHVDGIKPDFLEPGEGIVFRDPGGQEGGLQAAKEFGQLFRTEGRAAAQPAEAAAKSTSAKRQSRMAAPSSWLGWV